MLPKSIKQISVNGQVWGAALDEEEKCLFWEAREEKSRTISISRLELGGLKTKTKKLAVDWWDKLVGVSSNQVYFVKYLDQHDPTNQSFFSLDFKSGKRKELSRLPEFSFATMHPQIYEHGLEYFKTVSDFLSLELPLSCEYLEWQDKIIISYYLRSGNGFDRYLLLLEDGQKKWKVKQDEQMNGFSPGAFFVFDNQLIFIKDRNEVCVYTG